MLKVSMDKVNKREVMNVISNKIKLFLAIGVFFSVMSLLTGCSSITDDNYSSRVIYKKYNVDDKKIVGSNNPVLVIRSGEEFMFWVDMGNVIRGVGGTAWINKNNYNEQMAFFEAFIHWAELPKNEQLDTLSKYNDSAEFIRRGVAFGFFNDGSPAFIDKFQNTFAFERLYLPTYYLYYSEKSIKQLIKESAYAYLMLNRNLVF